MKNYINTKNESIDNSNLIKKINKQIKANDKQMENFTNKLGKLQGLAADSVINKMNNIAIENENLKQKLFMFEHEHILNSTISINIDFLHSKIKALLSNWKHLTIDEKQLEVQGIIKKIKWDGEYFTISFVQK